MSDPLQGQHVRLDIYSRADYPPDTLYTLWKAMQLDKATDKVFTQAPGDSAEPQTLGDLVDFVRMFEPQGQQRVLLIATSVKGAGATDADLAGMVWFDDFLGGRCAINAFYRRRYWGHPAREATRLALRWGFDAFAVPAIWAYTPWANAASHAEAVGMSKVARLPDYLVIGGTPRDLVILRMRKEEMV